METTTYRMNILWCKAHLAPVTHNDQGDEPDCVRQEWDPDLADVSDEHFLPCNVVPATVIEKGKP